MVNKKEPTIKIGANVRAGRFKWVDADHYPHLPDGSQCFEWHHTYRVRLPNIVTRGVIEEETVASFVTLVTLPDVPGLFIQSPYREGANKGMASLRALPLRLETRIRLLYLKWRVAALAKQITRECKIVAGQLLASTLVDIRYSPGQISARRKARIGLAGILARLNH